MPSDEQVVLAMDDERMAAAKNSDAVALDGIYTDDFQLILQNGSVRGKREQVDDYRSGALRYVSYELVERIGFSVMSRSYGRENDRSFCITSPRTLAETGGSREFGFCARAAGVFLPPTHLP